MARFLRWGIQRSRQPQALPLESPAPVARSPEFPHIQTRTFNGLATVERRSSSGERTGITAGRTITGLIPYGVRVDLGNGLLERFERGCFSDSLVTGDIRCLFNHDVGCLLGRQSSGTLVCWDDRAGLHFSASAPATQMADDLLTLMARKDVDGVSLVFYILESHVEQAGDGTRVRAVTRGSVVAVCISSFSELQTAQIDFDRAVESARVEARMLGFAEGLKQGRLSAEQGALRAAAKSTQHARQFMKGNPNNGSVQLFR